MIPQNSRTAFINAYFMNNLAKTPSKLSVYVPSASKNLCETTDVRPTNAPKNVNTDLCLNEALCTKEDGVRINSKISKRKSPKCSPKKLKQQKLDLYKSKNTLNTCKKEDYLNHDKKAKNLNDLRKTQLNELNNLTDPVSSMNDRKATLTTMCSDFEFNTRNTDSKVTAPSIHSTKLFCKKIGLETEKLGIGVESLFAKKDNSQSTVSGAYHIKLIDFIKTNRFEVPAKPAEKVKEEIKPQTNQNFNNELGAIKSQNHTSNPYPDYKILDYELNFHYKISKLLGKGSFAEVRLATRLSDNLQVAIKTYTNLSMNSQNKNIIIQNEIRALKSINHPNIIKLLDIVVTKDYTHLVLEYCVGINLYEFMWNRGRNGIPELFARGIFIQLLSALDYLHNQNIYHRDLKLDNVMIDKSGKVTLIDFGFAITVSNQEPISSFCGTPNYMAPEIYLRKRYSGQAIDIWALTVILYKLVAGEFPFKSMDKDKTPKTSIMEGRYEKPSNLSDALLDIFEKVFITDPENRYCMSELKAHVWLNL